MDLNLGLKKEESEKMENEEITEPHGQGKAQPTNPAINGSPKHNLGMGAHWVYVCGRKHVQGKTPAHTGFPPTQKSTRHE